MNRRELLSLAALPVVAPVVKMLPEPCCDGVPFIVDLDSYAWLLTDEDTGKKTLYRTIPRGFTHPRCFRFRTIRAIQKVEIHADGTQKELDWFICEDSETLALLT